MDANTQQTMPIEDTRNNRIGVMLNVLNQIMEDCEKYKIEWSTLSGAAANMWALRNSKDAWDCGRVEEVKKEGAAA